MCNGIPYLEQVVENINSLQIFSIFIISIVGGADRGKLYTTYNTARGYEWIFY